MVVLRTLLFASLATACYSPEIHDCTVACNQAADCAPSQVCGDDGFCASADVAGRCAQIAAPNDGGTDAKPDARPDARPDAANMVTLTVRVDGRGVVSIPTVGECDAGSGQAECPFAVDKNVPLTLNAEPKNNWQFAEWKEACDGTLTSTCVLTPTTNVAARVRFEMSDD